MLGQEIDESVAVFAHIAGYGVVQFREVCAFRLFVVEHVNVTEAHQNTLRIGACLLLVFVLVAAVTGHRSRIWMPFSPRFTNRPGSFRFPNPATRVAVGRCHAIWRIFPNE